MSERKEKSLEESEQSSNDGSIEQSAVNEHGEKIKIKAVVADVSKSVDQRARDIAEARLTARKAELRGIGGLWKKIWHHNLAYEYYRQKEIARVKAQILENENLFADEGPDRAHHEEAMRNIVSQFSSEYDDVIHKEAGERREVIRGDTEEERLIKERLQGLVKEYATKDLNNPEVVKEFNARKKEFFNRDVRDVNKKQFGDEVVEKGDLYADNLLEIVRQVQRSIEHGQDIATVELDIDLTVGRAREGVRTEAQFNAVDRLADRMTRLPVVGKLINETSASAVAAIVYSATAGGMRRVLGSKLAAAASFGGTALLGGGVAYMRESKRVAEERRQHARERAQGKRFDLENSPRRKEMEEFMYETRAASDLARSLEEAIWDKKPDGTRVEKRISSKQDLDVALSHLAQIEARIALSDRRNIDLIGYSDAKKVAEERLRLDILRAEAKVSLRKSGVDLGMPFDEYITKTRDAILSGETGVDRRDALFAKFKRNKAAWAAAKGVAIGLVVGATFQEGAALLRDDQQGVLESIVQGVRGMPHAGGTVVEHMTALEGLRHFMSGDTQAFLPSRFGTMHEMIVGQHHFKLPPDFAMLKNPDGTVNLMHDGAVLGDHLPVNPDGSLAPGAMATLQEKGLLVTPEAPVHIGSGGTQSSADFVKSHSWFKEIHRKLWYDNDTPKPVFDKNELKLDWGGSHNTGIDPQGHYVFNMARMTEDGSYHSSFSVDAQNAMHGGRLKMLLSLSQDTQRHVVEVPIDAHGNAVIDPASEIGKTFFRTIGGKAVFVGRFAEVAEIMDEKTGAVRVLATHVGKGISEVTGFGEEIHSTMIELPGGDVEIPIGIPIIPRIPLEPALANTEYMSYLYGGRLNEDQKERYRKSFSKELRGNPDAALNYQEEIRQYLEKQNPEYLKKLDAFAKEAGPMGKECRVAICIPVAGHEESHNIYATLENYTRQTADPKTFEVNLFVNNPEFDASGKSIDPSATLKEIERFRKDHPELNLRVFHGVIPRDRATMGYIRKTLNDTVLLRHQARGENAPELILVSNDADNKGMAPEYVGNFAQKFDENQNIDCFLGQLDWDPESYIRNPLVHIGTRLFQYLEVQGRRKGGMGSSGANFAIRGGTYAAVGGYSLDVNVGEDVDMGEKVRLARSGAKVKKPIAFAGARVSRLYTSSRRAEKVLRDGLAPIEQWDRGFGILDEEVRKVRWETQGKAPDLKNKDEVEKLVSALEGVINRTIRRTNAWGGSAYHEDFRKALGWLGLKFEIVNEGAIKITDASRLIEGIERYQQDGLEIMNRKKGITGKERQRGLEESDGNSNKRASKEAGSPERFGQIEAEYKRRYGIKISEITPKDYWKVDGGKAKLERIDDALKGLREDELEALRGKTIRFDNGTKHGVRKRGRGWYYGISASLSTDEMRDAIRQKVLTGEDEKEVKAAGVKKSP